VIVSVPNSTNTPETPVRASAAGSRGKGRADMYTALLAFALIAVLLSILFLWLYMKDAYDNKIKPPVAMVTVAARAGGETVAGWVGCSPLG
jgi:hypothetical protein